MEKEKIYFYDDEYLTKEDIYRMYEKLEDEQKKGFRDALAHFTLAKILYICNYDDDYIDGVHELAQIEASIIKLYGSDCGRVLILLKGQYKRNIRKLINLTGKLVCDNDSRIDKYMNGEELLNNLLDQTFGSCFEKDKIGDLSLVDSDALSEEECLAIADNFVRYMRDEEIVSYNASKHL